MSQGESQTAAKKRLPSWAGWLIGYAAVACGACALAYFWRVIFRLEAMPLLPLVAAILGVFSVLYLALFLLCRFCKNNICLQGAIGVFVLGLLFCFATAPLQAPDEQNHFLRAYSLSQGHLTYDYDRGYPDDVLLLLEKFPGFYNHQVTYQNREMAPAAFTEYKEAVQAGQQPADAMQELNHEPILFLSLPYLPQALFMFVGRLFGLSALGLLYAGRIANLAVYAVLCYFAFKNCDKYRGVFFALALLPLSLFMAASCSYDSIMLALCYLVISYFCKKEIHNRDVVFFGVALAVACYLKVNNIVLLAVLLLIPKSRWKAKINPWAAAGLMLGGAVLLYGVWGMLVDGSLLKVNFPAELPRGSGEEAAPMQQLRFVLGNPLRFLSTLGLTLYENGGFLSGLGTFGWTDVFIPLAGVLSLLSMSTSSALGIQQKEDTRPGGAVGLVLAAGVYALAVLAGMYVFETDLFSIRIVGAQPRYFLPAFLLLFMLGSILLGKAVRPRLAGGTALRTERITLCMASAVAVVSAVLLFQSTFIGQWLAKGEGGYKLVNWFGWVLT